MRAILMLFCICFSSVFCLADISSDYYASLKNAKFQIPIEKEFILNLKPDNPDNVRGGGYLKFNVTIVTDDKGATKEIEAKVDIIRSLIIDVTTGFSVIEMQGSAGRIKCAMTISSSINAILTDSKIDGVVFGNFTVQS